MTWTTWLAIYFVVWWLVLFTTLPFGVRNAEEAGEEVLPGNEAGAPVKHHLGLKVLATTLITGAIVGGFQLLIVYNIFDFRAYIMSE